MCGNIDSYCDYMQLCTKTRNVKFLLVHLLSTTKDFDSVQTNKKTNMLEVKDLTQL